jgi:hypothetical protein
VLFHVFTAHEGLPVHQHDGVHPQLHLRLLVETGQIALTP